MAKWLEKKDKTPFSARGKWHMICLCAPNLNSDSPPDDHFHVLLIKNIFSLQGMDNVEQI